MDDTKEVDRLGEAADALFFAMRRARTSTMHRADRSMTAAQASLLVPLLDAPSGRSVGQVAAAAAVSLPTATRALRQMEQQRLVERSRSTDDDRVVLVRLTQEGATSTRAVREGLRRDQQAIFRRFSSEERAALGRLLPRLATSIDELSDLRDG